jgi:glycosyltransferase involved in cell wall biosynthesis
MKVSVCMITYNHEKYIAQAIDSVLMQKTNFDYELVIGEDCSTDRTREILVQYHEKYPDKIKLVLNEKNSGAAKNFVNCYSSCTGDYIALLEGDDLWTSLYKLQTQKDFLDENLDCISCFHRSHIIDENGSLLDKEKYILPPRFQKTFTTPDILQYNFIPTASVIFRSGPVKKIPDELLHFWFLDWSLNILLTQYGKIGFIDEVMSAYRKTPQGMSARTNNCQKYQDTISVLNFFNNYFNFKYNTLIKTLMANNYFKLGLEYDKTGASDEARKCLIKSIWLNPKNLIRILLKKTNMKKFDLIKTE